jgi:ribosome biogenesis GTPase
MVVAVQANYYWVQLGEAGQAAQPNSLKADIRADQADAAPQKLLCTRRSRLKKIGQQVMVGDLVGIEEPDWADGRGRLLKCSLAALFWIVLQWRMRPKFC